MIDQTGQTFIARQERVSAAMRLLKRLPNGGFELVSVSSDNPPPYAILSHTWADDQEVTYSELVAGAGKDKKGYAKIRFCSERAAADGLDTAGSTLAASTRLPATSSVRQSTLCFAGISVHPSAMCTYQTSQCRTRTVMLKPFP